MAQNPYEAPQEPTEPERHEQPRWVHYVAASAAVIPVAIAFALVNEAYDRWQEQAFSGFPRVDLLIYAALFAAGGAVATVLVARLRNR